MEALALLEELVPRYSGCMRVLCWVLDNFADPQAICPVNYRPLLHAIGLTDPQGRITAITRLAFITPPAAATQ